MSTTVNFNQFDFSNGQYDFDVAAKSASEIFRKGLRKCENFDITRRGELVKRGGFKRGYYIRASDTEETKTIPYDSLDTQGRKISTRFTEKWINHFAVNIPIQGVSSEARGGSEDKKHGGRISEYYINIVEESISNTLNPDVESKVKIRYRVEAISYTRGGEGRIPIGPGDRSGKERRWATIWFRTLWYADEKPDTRWWSVYAGAQIVGVLGGASGGWPFKLESVEPSGAASERDIGPLGLDAYLGVAPYRLTYGPMTRDGEAQLERGSDINSLGVSEAVVDIATLSLGSALSSDLSHYTGSVSATLLTGADLDTVNSGAKLPIDSFGESTRYNEIWFETDYYPEVLWPDILTTGRRRYGSYDFEGGGSITSSSAILGRIRRAFPYGAIFYEGSVPSKLWEKCSMGLGIGGFFFSHFINSDASRSDIVLFWITKWIGGQYLVAPCVGRAYTDVRAKTRIAKYAWYQIPPATLDGYAITPLTSGESEEARWTKAKKKISEIFLGTTRIERIKDISYPTINSYDGLATSLVESNNRLHIGTKSGWVLSSWTKSPLGHAVVQPPAAVLPAALTDDIITKIGNGELNIHTAQKQTIGLTPSSLWSEDEIYWNDYYLDPQSAPKASRVPDKEEVEWMAHLRGLMVGTESTEISGEFTPQGDLSLRLAHSFEGSNSAVTAKGDYSFFFISRNGKRIHFLNYTQELRGFQSEDAMLLGGGFLEAGIRDMKWDRTRKALWVLSEDSRLGLFFLNKKYGIQGWTEYTLEIPGATVETKVTSLSNFRETFGFFTANPFSYIYLDPDATEDWADDGDEAKKSIISKAHFWKVPPMAERGSAAQWFKSVGPTTVLAKDCTELFIGGRQRQQLEKVGESQVYNINGVDITDNISHLPYLEIEHRKAEKCKILSTSSRITIEGQ